jgi:hypothetical protein
MQFECGRDTSLRRAPPRAVDRRLLRGSGVRLQELCPSPIGGVRSAAACTRLRMLPPHNRQPRETTGRPRVEMHTMAPNVAQTYSTWQTNFGLNQDFLRLDRFRP